jgi:trimeric autotransporter adhesin
VLTATIKDAAGNTVTTGDDATRSITFTQTGGTGSVGGIAGGRQATAGVATITVTGYAAGSVTTQAAATLAAGATQSNSLSLNVAVGAAAKLAFTMSPSDSTGGVTFSGQPVVTVQDFGGNTVTTDNGSVAVTIGTNPAGGTLSGTTTVNAVDGVASFAGLSIDKAASGYTLTASRNGLNPGTSAAFDITVGPAVKLAFTTSPSHSTGGTAFPAQPKVAIQDAGGNTVTTDASTVNLTITTGTPTSGGPGTLSGCTQTETAGIVNFAGCKIDTIGTGYRLHATDGTLTAADSATFNVYGNAAGLIFSNVKVNGSAATPNCTGTIGSTWSCTVTGGNNATITANVAFANGSGMATVYSSQSQSINWTATGKANPSSGSESVAGGQTTSGTTITAQKNGSNRAAITVTFTSWNGQTWTAVLTVS